MMGATYSNTICIILYDMHCTINISSLPNVVEHMTTTWTACSRTSLVNVHINNKYNGM